MDLVEVYEKTIVILIEIENDQTNVIEIQVRN